MKSLVLTSDSFDAVKLFYPDQYAFYIIDGKLACKLLPLRREALMTSNPRLVILDNAIELIVYRYALIKYYIYHIIIFEVG